MFDGVYFVSRLTDPTYINITGRKLTALIDMPKLVKNVQTKNIVKDQILEGSIILKRFQFKNVTEKGLKDVKTSSPNNVCS